MLLNVLHKIKALCTYSIMEMQHPKSVPWKVTTHGQTLCRHALACFDELSFQTVHKTVDVCPGTVDL